MELWKTIDIFDKTHQISNFGRVKSLPKKVRYVKKNGDEFFRQTSEKIMTQTVNKSGYVYVSFRNKNQTKTIAIHRLVAKYFILNKENKKQVNHIDGNKQNNHFSNLEWVTPKENMAHAIKENLMIKGENHYKSFFKKEDVLFIRSSKKTDKELGDYFGVDYRMIWQIRKFKTWKHL